MRFLIIGCGSIGQRHIRNLKMLGHKVSGCEADLLRARKVESAHNIEVFNELGEALKGDYDGAFICTPTNLHIPIAVKIAEKGINLFIEKPLSGDLRGISQLNLIVKRKDIVVLVACNTRFFPGLKLARKLIEEGKIGNVLSVKVQCGFYLPFWHPYEDYRKGYSANKRLGGGVIFDDIHELDSLLWLFGDIKEVFCFAGKISKLEIDTEDIAEMILKFKSGVVGQIHLDYLQRTYRRHYEFIGEKGMVIWDYIKQTVEWYTEKANQLKVFHESINTNREIMFIDEIKHFVNCIRGREKSVNDLSFAKKTMEAALACHRSAKEGKIIKI